MKANKKPMSKRTYLVLLLFFLAVLAVSGGLLIRQVLCYLEASEQYSSLTDSVITVVDDYDEEDDTDEETTERSNATPITVDFDTLLAGNSDVVGWLYSVEPDISYPVVQGSDNDYYLSHLYDGTSNSSGSIFMECSNDSTLDDRHTILYGHNMKDGSMFAGLMNYKTQEYYDEHPTMFYSTPDGDYLIEFYAAYLTDGYESIPISFTNDDAFVTYANGLKSVSYFDSDITIEADDKIISFYTCSYEVDEGRFILVGKLTPWEDR